MSVTEQKGFALVMCLLLLPSAILLFLICRQILFFNYVKNDILQNCFLISLKQMEQIESQNSSPFSVTDAEAELRQALLKRFTELTQKESNEFFKMHLKFDSIQIVDGAASLHNIESHARLQLGVNGFGPKFKNFEQTYKCGAYLKWKDSKKVYGITAVKF